MDCLDRLYQRKQEDIQQNLDIDLAIIYTGLKDYDKVFSHLDKAYEQRSGAMIFLNASPEWSKLRSDPRFNELIKRMGLNPLNA
jgi:hypothetical protein